MYPSLSRYFVPPLLLNVFASLFSQEKGNRSHVMALRINRHPNKLRGCRNFRTPYLCVCVCSGPAGSLAGLSASVQPSCQSVRGRGRLHRSTAKRYSCSASASFSTTKSLSVRLFVLYQKKGILWARAIIFGRYLISKVGVQKFIYC